MPNGWTISLLTLAATAGSLHAAEVFRDDFASTTFDTTKWSVGTWVKGRTQFGNVPVVSNGSAALRLDTYNPADPGGTFKGSSVTIRTPFSLGNGMEFEARVRTNAMPGGLLTSFFTYGGHDATLSDEIDFEFLTNTLSNRTGGDKYSLTSWNDWDTTNPQPNNTAIHSTANVTVPNLDVTTFNTLTMRWLPDHVEWLVNGNLVGSSTQAVPDDAMSVSLNFWAPESTWTSAYNAALQPTNSAGGSYFYDVDSVVVRSIPEPSAAVAFTGGALLLLTRNRRKAAIGLKSSSNELLS